MYDTWLETARANFEAALHRRRFWLVIRRELMKRRNREVVLLREIFWEER